MALGIAEEAIYNNSNEFLQYECAFNLMSHTCNSYSDRPVCKRIVDKLKTENYEL